MGLKDEEGPQSMKTIVCNTGPLLHLREIGMLDLLEKAGKVIIPKGIHVELSQMDPYWIGQKPSWISVEELPSGGNSKVNTLFTSGLLDMGEAEAILLAQHLKADWFLTDDASARTFANVIGLEVHSIEIDRLAFLCWFSQQPEKTIRTNHALSHALFHLK